MATDAKKLLAANVRKLMNERGWTQEDLAKKSGVAQRTISSIINTGNTSIGKVTQIAGAFGLEAWVLLAPHPVDTSTGKKLVGVLYDYLECGPSGRTQIERVAQAEVRYSRGG